MSIKELILKTTFLRKTARNLIYSIRKVRYKKSGKDVQTDEKVLIFGAYNGKSYACSPKSVYEYMIGSGKYDDYQYIWLFDEPDEYRFLEKNINTRVGKNSSVECEKWLHTAKYWIFNFRAQDHWIPKKDQIYVQCWHGTPLKRLGYDITTSDNAMNSISEIREKYRTDTKRLDYMVSPCDFVTEKFSSAWELRRFGKKNAVLQIGYPRNDFLKKFTEEDAKRIRTDLGLENEERKIILYAPTWRDNQHDANKGYVYDNPVDFDLLKEQLEDEYVILFRAHYLVADNFDFEAYKGFIYDVSAYDDINDLYISADILITDYSSVFFDYAILERPMLFYMYDMEEYRDEMRGFYLDVNDLPGPIIKTETELIEAVKNYEADPEQIRQFNGTYNSMNDGNAAKRLIEHIIG